MKAAVVGANGYIGKHLAVYLQQVGCQVQCYGRNEQSHSLPGNFTRLDVTSQSDYKNFDTDVDFVFYFSGLTGTYNAYLNYGSYIDVNEKGLLNLLDTLRVRGSAARVIFPSTRLVYKGIRGLPLKEGSEKEFKTIYALNKWFGEQLLQQYSMYFNIPFTIFRICVPFGNLLSNAYSYGTIGFFLGKAKAGESITLYGDGEQRRSFTHVADICNQIYNVTLHPSSVNQIYNISGENFSLKEIAVQIADKFKVSTQTVAWPLIDEKMESGDTIFDDAFLKQIMQNPLKYNFNEWLRSIS